MKAVKGYDKEYYRATSPSVEEFETIDQAAEALVNKFGGVKEYFINSIMDDTNCDCIYFPDDSVIILGF